MNWRYKAVVQNLIALSPMSDTLYYALQRTVGDLRPSRFDANEWIGSATEMLEWLEQAGFNIEGKRLLEVGTGRAICIPLIFWLCGAGQTVTVDINRYLAPPLLQVFVRYLCQNAARIEEILGPHESGCKLRERLQQLRAWTGNSQELFRLVNVEYHAPADARSLPFAEHSFDLHFSYSVCEHVPPAELLAILGEARRVLRPGGLLLHAIDLSDHFSYLDRGITRINCLQFSEKRWQRWAGNKYMYHNRLRASEFRRLFAQAGFRLRRELRTLDQRSLDALKSGFPLDQRFAGLQPDDLAVNALQVLGDFPEALPVKNGAAASDCLVEWRYLT